MYAHEREEYKHQMGHVWLGFSEEKIKKHLEAAGLGPPSIHPVPPEANAKGPALFAAVARRPLMEAANSTREYLAVVVKDTA
jgi:ArsR family transcriptional regulator